MNIPYAMKKCSKCGQWLVANRVNFYKQNTYKDKLDKTCISCRKERQRELDEIRWERSKKHKEANDKNKKARKRQYVRNVQYEYRKQYYENNKEKEAKRHKRWYEANKDKKAKYDKQYNQTPQGKVVRFNINQRRRAKEERLGSGITKDQWLEMMKFFNWRCAYSGEYLGGNDNSFNRTIDHIIPISKNGPNMVWNMVPMLKSLNSSKHDKDMLTWYKTQECFDRERLDKIYQWQEYAFNKWYKEEE